MSSEDYRQKYLTYKSKYLQQKGAHKDKTPIMIEPTTQKFLDSLVDTTPLFKMTPQQARDTLDKVQSDESYKKLVDMEDFKLPELDTAFTIFRPKGNNDLLNAVIYFHGGGWVIGNKQTHGRFVSDLVVGAGVAVVFVNYTLAPEKQYPVQQKQCFAATKYISMNGLKHNINPDRLILAGDSAGGNITATLAQWIVVNDLELSKKIVAEILLYPVTNFEMTTESYKKYADGYWLTKPATEWFYQQYAPNLRQRSDPSLSPLKAGDNIIRRLPQTLLITDENDVLRDEGEAYARLLMKNNVKVTAVRILGTVHDFLMLNPLKDTPAVIEATSITIDYIKRIFNAK